MADTATLHACPHDACDMQLVYAALVEHVDVCDARRTILNDDPRELTTSEVARLRGILATYRPRDAPHPSTIVGDDDDMPPLEETGRSVNVLAASEILQIPFTDTIIEPRSGTYGRRMLARLAGTDSIENRDHAPLEGTGPRGNTFPMPPPLEGTGRIAEFNRAVDVLAEQVGPERVEEVARTLRAQAEFTAQMRVLQRLMEARPTPTGPTGEGQQLSGWTLDGIVTTQRQQASVLAIAVDDSDIVNSQWPHDDDEGPSRSAHFHNTLGQTAVDADAFERNLQQMGFTRWDAAVRQDDDMPPLEEAPACNACAAAGRAHVCDHIATRVQRYEEARERARQFSIDMPPLEDTPSCDACTQTGHADQCTHFVDAQADELLRRRPPVDMDEVRRILRTTLPPLVARPSVLPIAVDDEDIYNSQWPHSLEDIEDDDDDDDIPCLEEVPACRACTQIGEADRCTHFTRAQEEAAADEQFRAALPLLVNGAELVMTSSRDPTTMRPMGLPPVLAWPIEDFDPDIVRNMPFNGDSEDGDGMPPLEDAPGPSRVEAPLSIGRWPLRQDEALQQELDRHDAAIMARQLAQRTALLRHTESVRNMPPSGDSEDGDDMPARPLDLVLSEMQDTAERQLAQSTALLRLTESVRNRLMDGWGSDDEADIY